MDPPWHADRTSRDLNSSSHIGDNLDGSQDAPGGSGTPQSPSWKFAFCTACRCTAYWSSLSWPIWRMWQEVQVKRCSSGHEVPLQYHWKLRASQVAINGLRGTHGREHLLHCCLLLPWSHWCCGGGEWRATFRAGPKWGGAHCPSTLGEGAPEEGGADLPALWTLADMMPGNWFTGVPTMATSAPEVLLTPGGLQSI